MTQPRRSVARSVNACRRALITTPESLELLLCRDDQAELFETLQCVIVDEWHELMATKRGVQVELALARLRALCPTLRTWGLSATLGNLDVACETLLGRDAQWRSPIRGASSAASCRRRSSSSR